MYENFYGLSGQPFEDRADTQMYVPLPNHEEVQAFIDYQVQYNQGPALVIGEAGTGKTLMVRRSLMRLHHQDQAVVITCVTDNRTPLIREVCKQFGVTLPTNYNRGKGLARLRSHLRRITANGKKAVLFIDQAENLSPRELQQLNDVANLHAGHNALLSLVIAGQPALSRTLENGGLESFRQQLSGERHLLPLDRDDTGELVNGRLAIAGAGECRIFDQEALDRIHEVAGGIPRLIVRIANEALITAYGRSARTVDRAIADEACSAWIAGDGHDIAPASEDDIAAEAPVDEVHERTLRELTTGEMESTAESADTIVAASAIQEVCEDIARAATATRRKDRTTADEPQSTKEHDVANANVSAEIGDSPFAALPDAHAGSSVVNREQAPIVQPDVTRADEAAELIERLERILAQARRAGTTTEATLAQSRAAEHNLESLTEQAQVIGRRLSEAVTGAFEAADRFDVSLRRKMDEARAGVASIRDSIPEMDERTAEADRRSDALRDACQDAAHVEAALKEFAEKLADKADAVQERLTAAAEETRIFEEARDCLARTLEEIDRKLPQADRTIRDILERAEKTSGTVEVRVKQVRSELAGAVVQTRRAVEQIKSESLVAIEKVLHRRCDEILAGKHAQILAAEKRVEQLEARMSEVSRRQIEIEQANDRNAQSVETTAARHTSLTGQVKQIDARIDELEHRATRIVGSTEAGLHDAEQALVELNAQARTFTSTRDEARAELARITQACAQAREQADKDLAVLRNAHDDQRKATESEIGRLRAAHAEARASTDDELTRITQVYNRAVEIGERAAAWKAAAETLQSMIASAGQQHQELKVCHDEIASAAKAWQETRIEADRQVAEIKQAVQSETARCDDAARSLKDILASVGAEAETKAIQLDSHNAAARTVLKQLNESSRTAHETLQKTGERIEQVQETEARIGRLVEDVWALAARAESCGQELEDTRRHADDTENALAERLAEGNQLVAQIEQAAGNAREQSDTLKTHAGRAADAATRLASIGKLVKAGKDIQERITEAARQAEKLTPELESATEAARSQVAVLGHLSDSTHELAARHEDLTAVSRQVAGELDARIAEAQEAGAAAERLLDGFTEQARSLAETIQALETRTNRIDDSIRDATQRPAELVKTAQAQAAQLERVCDSVRKVFASLSKATLEAREQSSKFKNMRDEVVDTVKMLARESDVVSGTLREWIEEAARIQARLERTIERAPSVRDTHPGAYLSRLSNRLRGQGDETSSLDRATLTMMPDPDEPVAETETSRTASGRGTTIAGGSLPRRDILSESMEQEDRAGIGTTATRQADQGDEAKEGITTEGTRTTSGTRAEEVARLLEDARLASNR